MPGRHFLRGPIAPKTMDVTFEREGPFLVARPKQPVPTLTNAVVNRTIAKIRRARGRPPTP